MCKVNTFIIGAQKAGTTSLYDWLGQHPEINAPSISKDYHYFTHEESYKKGSSNFHSFYKNNDCKIQLHAAVNYLYFFEISAKRLYDYNPDSKIIICLRNPVYRAISAYRYCVRSLKENNTFQEAIDRELNNNLSEIELADHSYLSHGYYEMQIRGFLEYFKKNQIHYILFEELVDHKIRENIMQDLFKFLNIDPLFKVNFTHLNRSGIPKSKILNYFLKKDHPLKFFIKKIPLNYRKKLSKRISEKNISNKKIDVEVNNKLKNELHELFLKNNTGLDKIINKEILDVWSVHE